jgi:hypothetical protein
MQTEAGGQPETCCDGHCTVCTCGYGCGCQEFAKAQKPVVGGTKSPDGAVSICFDLDSIDWPRNIASKGLGCCGFRSFDYCGRIQNVPSVVNLPEKMRDQGIAGGDYPSKHAQVVKKLCPDAQWWQDSGKHIELVEASIRSKRPCCVDYNGHDPHYGGQIAHCVTCVACDTKAGWVAILDNNYPSLDEIVWMSVEAFQKRWSGWSYGLLAVTPGAMACRNLNTNWTTLAERLAEPLFGLTREGHPWGDDASINGQPADLNSILDAIGPEMKPITIEPIKIDHQVDFENLKVPLMLAVAFGFSFWVITDKKGRL